MARVNAFLEAGNEHRRISVGGRSSNSSVWARLNTDNGEQSDCCLSVSANVVGDRDSKKEIDERQSRFFVTLPEMSSAVKVQIEDDSSTKRSKFLSAISEFASKLAGMWNVFKAEEPLVPTTAAAARELAILRQHYEDLPEIVLPGNVKLDYALACVRICEELFPRE